MKKNLQNKAKLFFAILGFLSAQMNAQTYNFESDLEGWANGFQMASTVQDETAANGWSDGGGLILTRSSNNSTIEAPTPLDGTVNNFLKIRVKNNSEATSIRFAVQEDNGSGGTTTIWLTQTIDANSNVFKTYYIKLDGPETIGGGEWAQSGQAANQPPSPTFWGEATETVFLLFRGGYVDDATTPGVEDAGKQIFVDKIEFVHIEAASTYADFSGAEGADEGAPGTIEPNANGFSNVTGWFFPGGGSRTGSFSDEQVFEGDYSIKTTITTAGTGNPSTGFLGSGAGNPAGSKFTTTEAGKHLIVINVFVESGNATQMQTNFDASSTSAFKTINWDITGLEKGKWHRLAQEVTFQNLDQDADAVVSEGVKMTLKVNEAADSDTNNIVIYFDGLEAIPASDYISSTGTNNAWANTGTWSKGAEPTSTDIVFIKNDVNIFLAGEEAKEIFVQDGKTLTFKNHTPSLTTEELHTGVTGSVVLESGSSLIVTGISTGKITAKLSLTGDASPLKAWHSVSSPVKGQTVANFMADHTLASGSATSANRGIATYNNATPAWNYYQDGYSGADSFDTKGYVVKLAAAGDVSFTGTYRSGTKNFTIAQGAGDHYNLVGNPFTSYVNVGNFFSDNTAANRLAEQTLYIWDPSTEMYVPKLSGTDASFEIAPGQAFFVTAGTASANKVTFSSANQSHQVTKTFLRSSRTEVSINVAQGDLENKTKVYYLEGVTKGFDNGYDGSVFGANNYKLAIYTQLVENNQGKDLAVQSVPKSDLETTIVPLGLLAKANEELTFTADALNIPDGVHVFLEDRQEGVFTSLNEINASYKVTLTEAANGIGRFYLHTSNSALGVTKVDATNISIYASNSSTLKIVGLEQGEASLKMFTILGKQVVNTSFNSNGVKEIALPKLALGVYLVQLKSATGTINKKIILE
ncbi:T9SS type A sorting domain-containing protein [Polaribacter sp.]|uniref:T9SS type A sorting domain-containing protein n=1 Tax=Polaribacter sp. TaxID=1920175 RepID=UPI003EF50168